MSLSRLGDESWALPLLFYKNGSGFSIELSFTLSHRGLFTHSD